MATIFVYVGNTAPSVTDTLQELKSNGSLGPIDLSLATAVKFRLRSDFGQAVLIDGNAAIVNAQLGKVRYDWTLPNTTTDINSSPGPYKAWWHLEFGATLLDTPEFDVMFLSHATRREIGPCTDWCSSQDVVGCFPDVVPSACLSSSVAMASEVLYELSGRQFTGWCQSVIRPCQDGGSCRACWQFLSRGHVVWSGQGWCDDNAGGEPCGCGSWIQKVKLPGIAQSVVQVLIDGAIVPSTSYRLDPNNELIRTDGGAWPLCQNMMAAGTAAGTFQITYQHGYAPNEIARRAAAQLAHEFYLACNAQPCRLPSGVVEVMRQGIKITRAASLFKDGATGLTMVDSFLAAFHQHPTTLVMSPEVMPTSRRTQ